MAWTPLFPELSIPGAPLFGLCPPSCLVEPWSLLAQQGEGFTARLIVSEDWSWIQWKICHVLANTTEWDVLQWHSGAWWVCPFSVLLEEVFFQVVWNSTLNVLALWSSGGAGQDPMLAASCLDSLGISYRAILVWLLLVLGLEVTLRGQAANQGLVKEKHWNDIF